MRVRHYYIVILTAFVVGLVTVATVRADPLPPAATQSSVNNWLVNIYRQPPGDGSTALVFAVEPVQSDPGAPATWTNGYSVGAGSSAGLYEGSSCIDIFGPGFSCHEAQYTGPIDGYSPVYVEYPGDGEYYDYNGSFARITSTYSFDYGQEIPTVTASILQSLLTAPVSFFTSNASTIFGAIIIVLSILFILWGFYSHIAPRKGQL